MALIFGKNDDLVSTVSLVSRAGFQVRGPAEMPSSGARGPVMSPRIARYADVISAFEPRFSTVLAYNACTRRLPIVDRYCEYRDVCLEVF